MLAMLVLGSVITVENLRTREAVIDATSAGTIYAVGANWKARLGSDGVEFTPFLGSDAPRNEHVRFAPAQVRLGGVLLDSNAEAAVHCSGHALRYPRGAFDEVFDARPEGLEHKLLFTSLPARGELTVRCPIDTSLTARQARNAIEFTNERGGVRYPNAIAFDDAGHRITLPVRLDGATLVLTVPDAFVETAVLPLTIDPLIEVFGVSIGLPDEFAADAAYRHGGPLGEYRCEVFETAWSLTDHDITARLAPVAGGAVTTLLIDASPEYWSRPKVASRTESSSVRKFLVVAAAGLPASGSRSIQSREIRLTSSALTLEAVVPIGAATSGDNHHPDVGGDSFSSGSSAPNYTGFFIVWQCDQPNGDSDVYGVRPPFPQYSLSVSPAFDDENPRVSKSCLDPGVIWCVVFERWASAGNRDIWGLRKDSYNGIPSPLKQLTTSPDDEFNPSVSSICPAPAPISVTPSFFDFVIAYERDMGGQRDIFIQSEAFSSFAPGVPAINLTQLEGGTHIALDQHWPAVDGCSSGLVLAYRETDPLDSSAGRTFVTSFALTASHQFELQETRRALGNPGTSRGGPNVTSRAAAYSTFAHPHFEVVWDEVTASGDSDVYGAIVYGTVAGAAQYVCFGDGSITACPCGQNAGFGCPNSTHATGGEMYWSGLADCSMDTFVVTGVNLPPSATVLLAGGTALDAGGSAFGDGLLCLSGPLTRLAVRFTNAAGGLTYPANGSEPRISTAGAVPPTGGFRTYQLVYRDSAQFCTSGTFNTTNALTVNWAP